MGLALLAQPIVTVLFERGAFGPAASLATAQVLAALALGLPAQVLAKVLAPGFFAREDTATPVRVAVVRAGASTWPRPSCSCRPLGHVGIALALSLSSWVNAAGLAWLLCAADGLLRPDARAAPPLPRHRSRRPLVMAGGAARGRRPAGASRGWRRWRW